MLMSVIFVRAKSSLTSGAFLKGEISETAVPRIESSFNGMPASGERSFTFVRFSESTSRGIPFNNARSLS